MDMDKFKWGVSVKLVELAVNVAYCGGGVPGFYVTW